MVISPLKQLISLRLRITQYSAPLSISRWTFFWALPQPSRDIASSIKARAVPLPSLELEIDGDHLLEPEDYGPSLKPKG